MNVEQKVILANLVADEKRIDFLPEFFGADLMLVGENYAYVWLSRLSKDYKGGYWNFYKLSNGGFYMAPAVPGKIEIIGFGNFYEGMVSADAAGIIATLFALGCLLEQFPAQRFIDLYHQLREYAYHHPECREILAAID